MNVLSVALYGGLGLAAIVMACIGFHKAFEHWRAIRTDLDDDEMKQWFEENRHLQELRFDEVQATNDLIRQNFFRRDVHALRLTQSAFIGIVLLLVAAFFFVRGYEKMTNTSFGTVRQMIGLSDYRS